MEKIKESIEKYKIDKMVFCLAYGIELIMVMIDKSALINPFEGRLFQITFALCLIKILMTKYNYRECLLMLVLGIIGFVSYKASGRNDMIRIVAFVMAAKDIDIKRLFKVTLIVTAISVVLLMLLSAAGVLGVNYVEADFRSTGVERRYCYGLGHPNAFYCMLLCILLLSIYVFWDKIKIYALLIAEAVGVFFLVTTESRTGFIIYTFAVGVVVLVKLRPSLIEEKTIYLLTAVSIILMTVFSIITNVTYYKYSAQLYDRLDRIITGRFFDAGINGNINTWSLFSNPANVSYFDMGYARLIYWYGWIPAFLCITAMMFLIYECYKKRDIAACIVILLLSLYTLFEAHIVSDYIARNYIIFILGGCWTQAFFVDKGQEMLIPKLFVDLFPKGRKHLDETDK